MPLTASNPNHEFESAVALALDIGTSSVRAALYDGEGNEIPDSTVKLEREFPAGSDGRSEIDANDAIRQIEIVIDDVIRGLSQTARIEIVAVSCLWHSLIAVDPAGNAVTPVLGWADTRAASVIKELQHSFDEHVTHARTGCRIHPSYWPAKLLWLRQQDKSLFHSATWMSLSEFVMMRFLGKAVISVSMASGTGLLNQRSCTWDVELISYLGIDVGQLPIVGEDAESFSGLVSEYAKRWPQLNHSCWFPAIGDGAANSIGSGCVTRDRIALMIGTSGAMRAAWEDTVPESIPDGLWCYRVDRNRIITGGALSDGGGLIAWIKTSLRLEETDDEIESLLSEMRPDEHGLTMLPFWAGERSTGWHASACGSIVGVTSRTRPIEILRAAMEAIAYRFAGIAFYLEELAPRAAIIASGGALNSSLVWTQMLADVLGRRITLSGIREASSRGAVLLALEMKGRIREIADAQVTLGQTYEPDMARHARYRDGVKRQERLYSKVFSEFE